MSNLKSKSEEKTTNCSWSVNRKSSIHQRISKRTRKVIKNQIQLISFELPIEEYLVKNT